MKSFIEYLDFLMEDTPEKNIKKLFYRDKTKTKKHPIEILKPDSSVSTRVISSGVTKQ